MRAAAVVLALAGCNDPCAHTACTAEFESISVHVTDGSGAPVTGLTAVTTLDATGRTFTASQADAFAAGDYIVIDDLQRRGVDGPAAVTFQVSSPTSSVTGHFEVGSDACQCHIYKVDGPNTLVLP
jgi:hypothetical protein